MQKINFKQLALYVALVVSIMGFYACEDDFPNNLALQPGLTTFEEDPRGKIVSTELLTTKTIEEVGAILKDEGIRDISGIFNLQYGVEFHKVIYETIDAKGNPVQASGGLAVPVDHAGDAPIALYCHGTVLRENEVPSALSREASIGMIFASEGFVVVLPDYLGFGPSPGIHPYHHAKSEATASIDILRAAKNEFSDLVNDQLLIFGYSQGGHAAMATVKEIEENHNDEFTVTASAPMSGAYDLSGIQATTFEEEKAYDAPYYLPYIMLAYNEVYDMYESTSDFLNAPWDVDLPPLFEGENGSGAVNRIMPEFPNQIIKKEVLDDFINNPESEFRKRLEENSLINWSPQSPMRIYYCNGDPLVLYPNSEKACESFAERSDAHPDMECKDMGPFDHAGCVLPSLLDARGWFYQMIQ